MEDDLPFHFSNLPFHSEQLPYQNSPSISHHFPFHSIAYPAPHPFVKFFAAPLSAVHQHFSNEESMFRSKVAVKDSQECDLIIFVLHSCRAGSRAVNLEGPSVYQGGAKCEIKHKATVFKRVSLLIGGAKHVDWGARPGPPLAPALHSCLLFANYLSKKLSPFWKKVTVRLTLTATNAQAVFCWQHFNKFVWKRKQ